MLTVRCARAFLYALVALVPLSTSAQNYPTRPIRMLNPLAAGGPTDILARMLSQPLSESLGKPIVVDNRPGASGNIAAEMAAKAAPDGHTLFIAGSGNFAINISLFGKLPYDPVRDFAPVALIASAPYIVAVHPAVPANSIKELIALAKAKPRELNYGAVTGNGAHLATELFKTAAAVDMVHIPYKGAVLATNDVLGGLTQVTFASMPGSMPHVKTGRLKALGITSARRLSLLPALPAVAETLPGFEASAWIGLAAPARTPREIVHRLSSEITAIVNSPAMRERMIAADYEPTLMGPEQFGAFIKSEIVKWAHAVKLSGARAE